MSENALQTPENQILMPKTGSKDDNITEKPELKREKNLKPQKNNALSIEKPDEKSLKTAVRRQHCAAAQTVVHCI